MTKRILLASAAFVLLATPAAADYARGVSAYEYGFFTTAHQEFLASANSGDAPSQFMLGRLYSEGRGVDRDFVQSYAWFDIAATDGYKPAVRARDTLSMTLSRAKLESGRALANKWRGSAVAAAPSTPAPMPVNYPAYSISGVQSALNALGYASGTVDGKMGPRTRAAIGAYQTDSNLPVSTQPSVSLYQHLQQSLTARTQPQAPAPATNATLVAEVQTELRLRDYPVPAVSGQLDDATVAAIRRYQADASLTVDGTVSDALLVQLRSGRLDEGAAYRDQVSALQTALNQRGFDAGPADGALGPKTRTAIRGYQQANGLSVTGEMSRGLLESMGLMAARGTSPEPTPSPANLQQAIEVELLRLGYAAGNADGVLDDQARKAIRHYQTAAGLKQTGEPSQKLLDGLRTSTNRNDGETLSLLVWNIEIELQERGYSPGPIDGTLDDTTRAAILNFQRDSDLATSGKASESLLVSLRDPSGGNATTLSSAEIWELEEQLRRLGYDVGTVDGVADQHTYAAVRTFQASQGLPQTGWLDQGLLRRVQAADAGLPASRYLSAKDFVTRELFRGAIELLDKK